MNVKYNKLRRMMEIGFQFRDVKEGNFFRNVYLYNEVPILASTIG